MLSRFLSYIQQEKLFDPSQSLLLAVSGGADSVALAHLCKEASFKFAIAHCNFQLRGDESIRDAIFVQTLAAKLEVPVFSIAFDTEAYVAEHKLSVQVAARQLRYEWLERTRIAKHYDFLVTAHHLQDNVETVLMNLCKGTGIAGLHGILPKQGHLLRPLLFTDKAGLLQYLAAENLKFVEDSSNLTEKYTRNFFRHQVIPALQEAYPQAVQNIGNTITHLREAETLYQQAIALHKKQLLTQKGINHMVAVAKLQKVTPLHTIAFELFAPFGCTPAQTGQVLQLLQAESGRFVDTPSHRILRDRAWLLMLPHTQPDNTIFVLDDDQASAHTAEGSLKISAAQGQPASIPDSPLLAYLDRKHVQFPLLLRRWKTGDYFYPLGMTKKKKLSRFFIDQKLSLAQKEKVWVVESNKRIVWIVGMRIDNRFKITEQTQDHLVVKWNNA